MYALPNTITNGDALDATPVQGNFADIENEIVNIEATQTTDGANITALKNTVEVGGWVLEDGTLAWTTTDGPTQTSTIAGDHTTKYYPGVRLKYSQTQALQNYWTGEDKEDSKGGATVANIETPTYTAGKFGNALTLNGTNQALSITDAATLKPTDNFTIGVWFKTSTNTAAIFQSYSDNINANGLLIQVAATGKIDYYVGNNAADATTILSCNTVVTDGNWHYLVVSCRNNYTQIYLDGKLDGSGYSVTPTYAATNYVRIGCRNLTGTNQVFFNGQIDDLFIAAYALDEQTIAAKYAAATAQGTGDITLTKYALVTASSYSAPNTTVTIYSGTDHTMMNATVSNTYYSTQKAPYGFPLGQDKWTTQVSPSKQSSAIASNNTWVAPNAISLSVPIGNWNLGYYVTAQCGATTGYGDLSVTLSNANNTEAYPIFTTMAANKAGGANKTTLSIFNPVSLSAKRTYYLNGNSTGGALNIYFGDNPQIIRAISTLL